MTDTETLLQTAAVQMEFRVTSLCLQLSREDFENWMEADRITAWTAIPYITDSQNNGPKEIDASMAIGILNSYQAHVIRKKESAENELSPRYLHFAFSGILKDLPIQDILLLIERAQLESTVPSQQNENNSQAPRPPSAGQRKKHADKLPVIIDGQQSLMPQTLYGLFLFSKFRASQEVKIFKVRDVQQFLADMGLLKNQTENSIRTTINNAVKTHPDFIQRAANAGDYTCGPNVSKIQFPQTESMPPQIAARLGLN